MKGKEIPVRDRIMRSGGCFAVILLAVSLLSPSASAEDRRTRQDELTIMTLNTEFMWDGIAPEEGQVDFAWKNDPTGAALHMQRVAQIILASDPDIVHLAEVENRRAVEKLNTDYLNGRGYVVYFVKKDTHSAGVPAARIDRRVRRERQRPMREIPKGIKTVCDFRSART